MRLLRAIAQTQEGVNGSPIRAEMLHRLIASGIVSLEDLLSLSDSEVQRRTGFSCESVESIKIAFALKIAPIPRSLGTPLMSRDDRFLTTHVEWLDKLLGGGFEYGTITEVFGPPAVGKTQLCAHVIASCGREVAVADTHHSYSPSRLVSLGSHTDLGKIHLFHVHSVFSLFDVLERIPESVRLIVVDAVSALLAPLLGGGSSGGHLLMTRLAAMLNERASPFRCAVVIVNSTVSSDSVKAALGGTWAQFAHNQIVLLHSSEDTTVQVVRSKSGLVSRPISVGISEKGFQPAQ